MVKLDHKKVLSVVFSIIFFITFGISLVFLILSIFFAITITNLCWEYWSIFLLLSVIAFLLVNIYRFRKKKISSKTRTEEVARGEIDEIYGGLDEMRGDLEKFEEECQAAIKAHLKISSLFWIHYYKKERVKSLVDTKEEVFKDLRKEFLHIPWMADVVSEIKGELTKYK